MPFSNYALDTFISQDLSQLTNCTPRSFGDEFANRSDWFDEFVLRRIFNAHVPDDRAPLAFAIIRRAEGALDEWELACATAAGGDMRKPSVYFRVLRHFESCIAYLWQGLAFCRRALSRDIFQKGDGSPENRLNHIYNVGRHFDPSKLGDGDLHRVWLANDEVRTREHTLTFEELRDCLSTLARIANSLVTGTVDS